MLKQVILKIEPETNNVLLDIREGGKHKERCIGKLAPASDIKQALKEWQENYHILVDSNSRAIVPKPVEVTNISYQETGDEFVKELNKWLEHTPCAEWNKIKNTLRKNLNENDEIHVIIETSDIIINQIPWHLWNLFDEYENSEFALSSLEYKKKSKIQKKNNLVKILAILGDSTGINIEEDKKIIEQLPGAQITFIVEPNCEELKTSLWEKQYDILFFAGHSSSQNNATTGKIAINQTESISITVLKEALEHSVKHGLKLTIFNSCNGLGLGHELTSLIPYIVVMREAISNLAAQKFLKFFLEKMTEGKGNNSLFTSVRYTRKRLKDLDNNDDRAFKFASWLPTIFHNSTEELLTWEYLRYGKKRKDYPIKTIFQILIFLTPVIIYLVNTNPQIKDGVELNRYCEDEYGIGFLSDPPLNNAYGWTCKNNKGVTHPITEQDIKKACKQQHNTDRIHLNSKNDTWGWRCLK